MSDRKTRTLSARFSASVIDRLERHSASVAQSKARVAERLIDEGLRMEEFPGIVFRAGPTGRRAGLVGGPDVWEIVRDVRGVAAEGADDLISAVSAVTGLDPGKIELAVRYYSAYPEEIDHRIRASEEATERVRRALEFTPTT